YIPIGHQMALGDSPQLPLDDVLAAIKPLFEDEAIEKTAHNGKADLILLRERGIDTQNFAFDTMLAAYILGETVSTMSSTERAGAGSISLKWLVSQRIGVEMKEIVLLLGKNGAKQLSVDQVSVGDASEYCCADVDFTLRLRGALERELREQKMWDLFNDIEMPLVQVLSKMEAAGIAMDVNVLRDLGVGLSEQVDFLETKAYTEVGHQFNLGSPPQLGQVLFEELNLPHTRKT